MITVKKYSKLLVWAVFAALMLLPSALGDGHISAVEGVQMLIAAAGAVVVWVSGHLPANVTWPKTVAGAAAAGLALLVTAVAAGGFSGVTPAEWSNIALAVLGALGVGVVPTVVAPLAGPRPVEAP